MSKSYVQDLLGLYECIFQDASHTFPELEREFRKDYDRLRVCAEQRGISVFTDSLVAFGKHFDRCLSNRTYYPPGLPLTKRISSGNKAPRFIGRLVLRVFNADGSLKENPCKDSIFFIRQITLACKKINLPCPLSAVHREVNELIEGDRNLPEPQGFWNNNDEELSTDGFHQDPSFESLAVPPSGGGLRRSLLSTLDFVSRVVTSTLGSYDPSSWRFRHGTGAVSEGPRTLHKYLWGVWDPILEQSFPIADYGFHNYGSWARSLPDLDVESLRESTSRLVAVPKSVDRPRLIACEPAAKQWCQQNMLDFLVCRFSQSWIGAFIKIDDQTYNQDLCREGSRTGKLCTIDLSSASDSVSCRVVGHFFQGNLPLLKCLRAVRTPILEQDLSPNDSRRIELRKFSMMGSAVTFPIESLVFLGVCISAALYVRQLPLTLRSIKSLIGEVSVYGDDLVIPKDCWEATIGLLETLGFRVNVSKSFSEGNFRESCGVDAFDGVSVTPVYWRGPYGADPDSQMALLSTSNNLYNRFLVSSAAYVRRGLRRGFPTVRPQSGLAGCHSRIPGPLPDFVRFCDRHHRWKALITGHKACTTRAPTDDECAILQYFTESPDPFIKWTSGSQRRVTSKLVRRWAALEDLFILGQVEKG